MTSGSFLLLASSSDLYLSGGLSAACPTWVVTRLDSTPLRTSVQIALEFRRDHVSKRVLFDTTFLKDFYDSCREKGA
jgi:hypothetical protein